MVGCVVRLLRCPVRLPALGPAGWLLLLPPGLVFVPLVGRLSVFFLLAPIPGWPPRLSVACLCPRLSLPVCLPAAPCSPRAALLDAFFLLRWLGALFLLVSLPDGYFLFPVCFILCFASSLAFSSTRSGSLPWPLCGTASSPSANAVFFANVVVFVLGCCPRTA